MEMVFFFNEENLFNKEFLNFFYFYKDKFFETLPKNNKF